MSNPMNPILSVEDLDVKFHLRGETLHAIRGISLDVYKGVLPSSVNLAPASLFLPRPFLGSWTRTVFWTADTSTFI